MRSESEVAFASLLSQQHFCKNKSKSVDMRLASVSFVAYSVETCVRCGSISEARFTKYLTIYHTIIVPLS